MTSNDTLMWEARAVEGGQHALLDWVERTGLPAITGGERFLDADVYLGGQDRVVVIAHWHEQAGRLPDPPSELLARPVAQWPFSRHRRV